MSRVRGVDDLRSHLARLLFNPLYERRWGLYAPELDRALAASQYFEPARIREESFARLRSLVEFAEAENPHYRAKFEAAGVDARSLESWDDFERIPLLTKDELRQGPENFLSRGFTPERMFYKRTGGSTGVPVRLYWDGNSHRFKRSVVKRHDAWAGYVLGRRQAALWGDTEKSYPLKERLYKALCERTIFLDTLLMDAEYMDGFVRRLRDFGARCLIGHAHSIFFFTEHVVETRADDIGFDTIISTAETLTDEERAFIENRFGRVLYDRYGCEEVSLIASECDAHEGLHVNTDGLYVELVDDQGRAHHWWDEEPPAEAPLRIVVTDLTNRGMPFLRYEVGDLGRWARGRCPCGRTLPRLERVFGRVTDILYAPDGRKISGVSILDTFIIHVPGIRQAQIVQDELDHIELRVVPDANFSAESRERLARTVQEVFGPTMRHSLREVERIEPTPRGKYQFTICEIPPPGETKR